MPHLRPSFHLVFWGYLKSRQQCRGFFFLWQPQIYFLGILAPPAWQAKPASQFMDNQQSYNLWAGSYDSAINKTRDLEASAMRTALGGVSYKNVLEIGCGTGKNTVWLAKNALKITGADFSGEMLEQAKTKITAKNVQFLPMDVREAWPFPENHFDLITCSLMLEHIMDIAFVFQQAQKVLLAEGQFYIGELHPFKQYEGSKARFETENGTQVLECFTHHVSDFFKAATDNLFQVIETNEWFDEDNRSLVPRILAMKFRSGK